MKRLFRACLAVLAAAASLFSGLSVQAADLAEIRERGVLRHIGIRYANFVTDKGQGLDVEIVQGFARHIGVRYELVYSDFYNVVRDLLGQDVVRDGDKVSLTGSHPVKGDMIATGFTILPWREAVLLFSRPTFPSQVLLVTRTESPMRPVARQSSLAREIEATHKLIGRKSLLVMERTCLDPANYGLKGVGLDLRMHTASTDLHDMVPAMLRGEAELTLLDVPDVVLDLQRWAGRIKVLGPISEHQDLAAAFPRSSPALRDAFDAYFQGIRASGEYDRLVNKYYPGIRRYFPQFFARKQ